MSPAVFYQALSDARRRELAEALWFGKRPGGGLKGRQGVGDLTPDRVFLYLNLQLEADSNLRVAGLAGFTAEERTLLDSTIAFARISFAPRPPSVSPPPRVAPARSAPKEAPAAPTVPPAAGPAPVPPTPTPTKEEEQPAQAEPKPTASAPPPDLGPRTFYVNEVPRGAEADAEETPPIPPVPPPSPPPEQPPEFGKPLHEWKVPTAPGNGHSLLFERMSEEEVLAYVATMDPAGRRDLAEKLGRMRALAERVLPLLVAYGLAEAKVKAETIEVVR